MSFSNKMRRFFVLFFVVLSCAVFATGCDDVIADPNFHTWCGGISRKTVGKKLDDVHALVAQLGSAS